MPSSDVRLQDGTFDFSQGVDSGRVTTIQSPANPNGLPRTMLAWLNNGTVRDGPISPRSGWTQLAVITTQGKLYQGGYLYEPLLGNPYLMLSIGGLIFRVRVDTNNEIDQLTTPTGVDGNGVQLANPASAPQAYFCQGEQFLVIQAGDWAVNQKGTLPLFWDGKSMWRSKGIVQPNVGLNSGNQLPAALAMTYYQGRIWYANGRTYTAGDIVGDVNSGTAANNFSDSVLAVTENPLAFGGDGFTVPAGAGNITALNWTAQLDATLGQGNLYIFTRKRIYALVVPVTRASWIAATANNQPQQLVAQTQFGSVSERGVIQVNGDLYYPSPEPGIRSLIVATRFFQQYGNVPISRNIQRALNFTTPQLMGTATGINFDNRMLMGLLPVQTPVGVAFQGVAALNFDLVSTLQEQLPPAWEGLLEGFDVLQMFAGDYGGNQRAFAVVHNRTNHNIEIWEINSGASNVGTDTGSSASRVTWQFESPAFTFSKERDLKELDGGEIWLDNISGTIEIVVEYRVDADACWNNWAQTQFCAAESSCQTVENPVCYPVTPFCQGQKFPIGLPKPPATGTVEMNQRPSNIGYQFQVRCKITGSCRVRGIILYALPRMAQPFYNMIQP